ncbi:hypothetical protein [Micromonospora pallida]|nr:hypothetical protein [Micromonospora pallida]
MDDETADDSTPPTWARVGDPPGRPRLDWLDYGDAEQLMEMSTLAEAASGETLELVDTPVGDLPTDPWLDPPMTPPGGTDPPVTSPGRTDASRGRPRRRRPLPT